MAKKKKLPINQKPKVVIYTDGACSDNRGGWAATLSCNGESINIMGNDPNTTNNRMELLAVIKALEILQVSCDVEIYSDSQYVVKGIMSWLKSWERNNWKTQEGRPVSNQDMWKQLKELISKHKVRAYWVKGHADNEQNNVVDSLAQYMRTQPA